MNAMMMLWVAIVLLLVAAVGGLVMAGIRFSKNANPPAWLAMVHGFVAGSAATLLLYAALVAGLPMLANIGIVVLLGAALLGASLNLVYQWQRQLLPTNLVVIHAIAAVVGLGLLVAGGLGY